ncbi:dihydrolipoamide acetyltransferase family protein [Psychromicrobium xiongbiense]|uniref:dihydrolipoamide acetyltransferase family protein n=1 Tax=Psychromicrobium xiongbiense TaxID=3051184 RepID=UPI002552ADF0|nr:dihydrolipoamide acetyltransferase family protein [Psychromicrobium sp. YIM S02556]
MNSFKLPDVGEGLTEAEIVSWKVSVGQEVAVNEVLVEIETAKSLVELPSPYAGTVTALLVAEGETVDVGTPIITIGSAAETQAAASPVGSDGQILSSGEASVDPALVSSENRRTMLPTGTPSPDIHLPASAHEDAATEALVGSGPKADPVRRRARRTDSAGVPPAAVPSAGTLNSTIPAVGANRALSTPPVRKAAKDLGIDLAQVPATGGQGQVTRRDLEEFHRNAHTFIPNPAANPRRHGGLVEATFDGSVERVPVKGVRKVTAQAMVASAFSAPHASIFVDVDATRTMEFVAKLKGSRDYEGIKVSPLLIVAKAVIWAALRNPQVNATWTDEEILIKHFVNLGIAAATPRGLIVPNIKDAHTLSLRELAVAIGELSSTARAGKTSPAQQQGGSITITNIGALGLDAGTPIINPGEVAIMAFGTIKQKPWVVDGEVRPRWVTTVGGSFDHRVVDGDLSARFIGDVASILEEPALLLE